MDLSRIELALREGPPDEPVYIPGSFRRSGPRTASLTLVSLAVSLALVLGIAIGTGLAVLRGEYFIGSGARPLAAADLLGSWSTGDISRQEWIDGAAAAGFSQSAIDAFLEHDPIQDRVRYTVEFFTGATFTDRFMVKAEYDGHPIEDLGGGAYAVGADGTLRLTEIVPGTPEPRCTVDFSVNLRGDQLSLQLLGMQDCDPDAQLAFTVFFGIDTYTRQGS